jgi:hypothetical protein
MVDRDESCISKEDHTMRISCLFLESAFANRVGSVKSGGTPTISLLKSKHNWTQELFTLDMVLMKR